MLTTMFQEAADWVRVWWGARYTGMELEIPRSSEVVKRALEARPRFKERRLGWSDLEQAWRDVTAPSFAPASPWSGEGDGKEVDALYRTMEAIIVRAWSGEKVRASALTCFSRAKKKAWKLAKEGCVEKERRAAQKLATIVITLAPEGEEWTSRATRDVVVRMKQGAAGQELEAAAGRHWSTKIESESFKNQVLESWRESPLGTRMRNVSGRRPRRRSTR